MLIHISCICMQPLLCLYNTTHLWCWCADGTSEQTFLDGSTSASIAACNSVHPLSTVSSLSHKFNIEAFTSPSTKVGIHSVFLSFTLFLLLCWFLILMSMWSENFAEVKYSNSSQSSTEIVDNICFLRNMFSVNDVADVTIVAKIPSNWNKFINRGH